MLSWGGINVSPEILHGTWKTSFNSYAFILEWYHMFMSTDADLHL